MVLESELPGSTHFHTVFLRTIAGPVCLATDSLTISEARGEFHTARCAGCPDER